MHICDFCGKDQTQVGRMIAGRSVDICNECVYLCMNILMEEAQNELKRIKIKED